VCDSFHGEEAFVTSSEAAVTTVDRKQKFHGV